MLKTTNIITKLPIENVKEKLNKLGNELGYFIIQKEDRIIIKRELEYSNGTTTIMQEYTFLYIEKENGRNEILITLEITGNFINKTIEKMYVTDKNTQESLDSMKNVVKCIFEDDMPRSVDLQIISNDEPPTSTGLKTFMYASIVFTVAMLMFALNKCN